MNKEFGISSPIFFAEDDNWVIQSQTINKREHSTAEALNEEGDIVARAYYGGGLTEEVSETYQLKSGKVTELPALGMYTDRGIIVTSVDASTSNADWPTLSISLHRVVDKAPIAFTNPKRYAFPAVALAAKRMAQPLFITGGDAVQSTSLAGSCSLAEMADGSGNPCAWAVSGAVWSANIEALGGEFALASNLGDTAGIIADSNISYSNTSWGTITGSAGGAMVASPVAA